MGMEKGIEKPRTPDVANNSDLVTCESNTLKRFVKGMDNSVMGASGTKNRRSVFIQKAIHR
jgi:hypothetical protein